MCFVALQTREIDSASVPLLFSFVPPHASLALQFSNSNLPNAWWVGRDHPRGRPGCVVWSLGHRVRGHHWSSHSACCCLDPPPSVGERWLSITDRLKAHFHSHTRIYDPSILLKKIAQKNIQFSVFSRPLMWSILHENLCCQWETNSVAQSHDKVKFIFVCFVTRD